MQKQKINHVGMLLMNRCIFTHNMHLEITLLLSTTKSVVVLILTYHATSAIEQAACKYSTIQF